LVLPLILECHFKVKRSRQPQKFRPDISESIHSVFQVETQLAGGRRTGAPRVKGDIIVVYLPQTPQYEYLAPLRPRFLFSEQNSPCNKCTLGLLTGRLACR